MSDGELHAVVVELGELSTRLEAQWCRAIARWDARMVWADNGSRSPGARLARETGRRPGGCGRLVSRARKLATMPVTATAYASGEISGDHVDLVGECNRQWPDGDFADAEAVLVDACRTPWFADAVKVIEYWKQHANPDGADADADWLREGRTASITTGWNGEVHLDAVFDPIGGEVFRNALAAIEHELLQADRRDGIRRARRGNAASTPSSKWRRVPPRAPPDGLRPRPLFTVLIGDEALRRTCETAHGTVIAPGVLMPLLSDAEFERIVYDPPNRRIEVSHRRRFTGALRRVIEVRDRHCQHPSGCDVPAADCDVDHIIPHAHGGPPACATDACCAPPTTASPSTTAPDHRSAKDMPTRSPSHAVRRRAGRSPATAASPQRDPAPRPSRPDLRPGES